MNLAIMRLTWKNAVGNVAILILMLTPVVALAFSMGYRLITGSATSMLLWQTIDVGVMASVVPALGIVMGSVVLTRDIETGAITYLLTKPVYRPIIAVSKFVVAAGIAGALSGLTVIAVALGFGKISGNLDQLVHYCFSALVEGSAYVAVTMVIATLTSRALVIMFMYALIWEVSIGGFATGIRPSGLSYLGRTLGMRDLASNEKFAEATPEYPLVAVTDMSMANAGVLLIVLTLVALAAAGILVQRISMNPDN